ncbi:MAG: acyl-CoA thioesterase [Alphaproteobacteria bacterium]
MGIVPVPEAGDVDPPQQPAAPPFVHRCRVTWADCDIAQIAYTGRLPCFALDAIDAFWEAAVGVDWYRLTLDHGLSTPFVRLAMDLASPVTPRLPLDCTVAVARLGRTSIGFRVEGRQGGTLCFTGDFVCVFVRSDSFTKIEIPPRLRAAAAVHAIAGG